MFSGLSILHSLYNADIIIKIVIAILIFCSIGTWAIFMQKTSSFKIIETKNKAFEKQFWSGVMLETFYTEIKAGEYKSDYASIFSAAMEEWVLSDITKAVMAVEFVKIGIRERVAIATENCKENIRIRLNKGLIFLTIIAATAPFIGLFGTVWGIMNSFGSLANASSVTLSAVAPGISEALFSTAIGLFVALPAVIFYHKISSKIEEMNIIMDIFCSDVTNVLSRELDKFSINNYLEFNKK